MTKQPENEKKVQAQALHQEPKEAQGEEESVDLLEKKLKDCDMQVQQWKEKFLRVTADYENFSRRVTKERSQWAHEAQAEILKGVVALLDDIDRALEDVPENLEGTEVQWVAGFRMIQDAFRKMLTGFEVTQMDNYDAFDPEFHEALMQVDSKEHDAGSIVKVLEKGYLLKGHVLRVAKVSVAR